ncbi:hypothetical protein EGM51_14195 [Verrucomicrobia bacterium S94]|nr:hypothetical protein EGM51_14195 [Verrucomicrobia bacterium S94]
MKWHAGAYNPFQPRYSIANPPTLVFKDRMQLFKEPLLHFVLLGALFFGAYAWLNRPDRAERLVITESAVRQLTEEFSRDWNRDPTAEELQELLHDHIREELAVREGLALGLDQNDPVIRQRIRQKLELMVEEEAVVREPTDEELAVYLCENADLFCDENGVLPELDQIRNLVIFEWENQIRLQQLDRFYNDLESKYGVQIEQ